MNARIWAAQALLPAALCAWPAFGQQAATAPPPAQAASDEAALNEIVVTGLRQSLNEADMVKRLNTNGVDSIIAQDVNKLPDEPVCDTLQRVTGVQVTRNNDQVVGVNVRGLPNVVTTLNGDEILHHQAAHLRLPEPARRGALERRRLQDQFRGPIEGGIAGLIDVRTHRPFDFEGLELAGSATAAYHTIVGARDPRGPYAGRDGKSVMDGYGTTVLVEKRWASTRW